MGHGSLWDGFFVGTLSQALRARLRLVGPYGTQLAAISQQLLASGCCEMGFSPRERSRKRS
jgi:hypothetical protein